jgi:Nucleoside transporter
MLLLGAGLLLPYSVLVTAADYWDLLYPGKDLEFYIPMVMNVPSPILQILMIKYGQNMSFSIRIFFWFALETGMLVLLPFYEHAFNQDTALYLTLASIFLFGASTAILQSTLFGFAGLLPPTYTQAIMSGQGGAGLVIGALRIITKVAYPDSPHGTRASGQLYFFISAFIVFSCIVSYLILVRLEYTQHYVNAETRPATTHNTPAKKRRPISNNNTPSSRATHYTPGRSLENSFSPLPSTSAEYNSSSSMQVSRALSDGAVVHPVIPENSALTHSDDFSSDSPSPVTHITYPSGKMNALPGASPDDPHYAPVSPGPVSFRKFIENTTHHHTHADEEWLRHHDAAGHEIDGYSDDAQEYLELEYGTLPYYWDLFKQIQHLAIGVCAVFTLTFMVFPGLLTEMNSSYGLSKGWFSIILITQFTVFDTIGRTAPAWKIFIEHRDLWKWIGVRCIMFPLFLFCTKPHWFVSDIFPYAFLIVFSMSNGYLASLCMMYAPSIVDDDDRESAGYIMSLCLQTGILLGSNIALAMHALGIGAT